jgi:hypothetical protein
VEPPDPQQSDPPPPPTPYERAVDHAGERAVERPGAARAPRGRAPRIVVSLLLVIAVALGVWTELRDGGRADQRAVRVEQTRDEALLQLFEEIERSEGEMLGFYDRLGDELGDPSTTRDEVLTIIAAAAADAVDELRAVRVRIVPLADDSVVDDVRAAYLPHLDSWIDYLTAVAEDPDLELERERAAPFMLLINSTARTFRVATELMLETGPSDDVARLADEILEEGFRGFDDEVDT